MIDWGWIDNITLIFYRETYITNLMLNVDNEKQVSIPKKVLSQKYISIIVVSLNCSGND